MNLVKYAKSKGMNLEQYETLKSNVEQIAIAILEVIKTLHKPDTGVYYPTNEIIHYMSDAELKGYIIVELKKLGVEFFDNNTLYRY